MVNLRQLATFVAAYEEGSLSKAAERLHATQAGLSVQNQNLEAALGVQLFERSPRGVKPTFAGHRLYEKAIEVLHNLDWIAVEMKSLQLGVSGELKVGLMPTFTRSVLSPALAEFIAAYPNVTIRVSEGYSALLSEQVATEQLDFAIVPSAPKDARMKTTWLGTDREVLVTRPGGSIPHLQPVRLTELSPLKYILPATGNARRDKLDNYWNLHGLSRKALVEMDAMIATLEFVSASDYVTILPEIICLKDIDGKERSLHPILDEGVGVDYAIIQPAKAQLSRAADLFLGELRRHYAMLKSSWATACAAVTADL